MFRAVPTELKTNPRFGLNGLMLACTECGRPIRLLHVRGISHSRTQVDKGEMKRVMRAARRRRKDA